MPRNSGSDQVDFSQRWTKHLRENSKSTSVYPCPFCDDKRVHATEEELWNHVTANHGERLPPDEATAQEFRKGLQQQFTSKPNVRNDQSRRSAENSQSLGRSKRPFSTPSPITPSGEMSKLTLESGLGDSRQETSLGEAINFTPTADQPRKRPAFDDNGSPSSSMRARDSESPPPRRSKARPASSQSQSESFRLHGSQRLSGQSFAEMPVSRPSTAGKRLWQPETDTPPRNPIKTTPTTPPKQRISTNQQRDRRSYNVVASQNTTSRPLSSHQPGTIPAAILSKGHTPSNSFSQDEGHLGIILQPETRPISQEQLVAEVKGIYAGLVMVEAKCIEVDNKQATVVQTSESGAQPKLNNEQWQALIALHRTLLHEHHDFFLASQHPSASPALRKLASKYAMPARMWRHGIHQFLELLRHRLPASLDHMLAFIYLAYSMMALLYETVPAFEDTWIECLGDLGRYRMAIEDDDIRDREVWTGVARHWYSKASDKSPTTGRLYHHLAILARPNALQQLFYYAKSLSVKQPFASARESILTLFDPVLNSKQGQHRSPLIDTAFIKIHAMLFTHTNMDEFRGNIDEFTSLLDSHIGRVTRKFMEQGYQIAVANSVALLGFGSTNSILMKTLMVSDKEADVEMEGYQNSEGMKAQEFFENALRLHNKTVELVLLRIGDPNVLPFVHITLVFLYHMSRSPAAMNHLEASFPWETLAIFLNTLTSTCGNPRIESEDFPLPEKDDVRPFPEDFAIRGLLWTEHYFPDKWFSNPKIDDEERYLEAASMTDERKERILWLARRLSKSITQLDYDETLGRFHDMVVETDTNPAEEQQRELSVDSSSTIGPACELEHLSMGSRTTTWASETIMSEDSSCPTAVPDNPNGTENINTSKDPP